MQKIPVLAPPRVLVVSALSTHQFAGAAAWEAALGVEVDAADNLIEAEAMLALGRWHCALVDSRLGDGGVLAFLARQAGRVPTIVFGHDSSRFQRVARERGAVDVLGEEVDLRLLERSVRIALERRRFDDLRAGLVEAQRLQSLGLLAATLFHDLATPLTVFGVVGDLLDDCFEDLPEELQAHVPLLQIATNHLIGLRRSVQLQGRSSVDWTTFDPLEAIEDAARIAGGYVGRWATVEVVGGRRCSVRGERASLVQLVINLMTNAAHAVRDKGDGPGAVLVRVDTSEGRCRIAVEDDGVGLPRALLSRIFEPWYTDQAKGRGTGLGLSLAREIAHRHGGTLEVSSQVGVGTRFTLTLPCVRT